MSTSFNLGLPTDIPWKRICFTDDMTHSPICGTPPPPQWRSSMAVFRYDPEPEYQTLTGFLISYLKVAVTITPDAPDLPINSYVGKYVPQAWKATAQGSVAGAFACYGALLQISVGPKGGGTANEIYFADFEPKKRELYEAVTDVGQIASGSNSKLSVGKSATTSHSTESYNKLSGSAGVDLTLGVGDVLHLGASGETSTTNRTGMEKTDVTTTDRSTERRELQSHTTELSQMYNLFQAFHVGTNRALFFMEPRPHIVQGEATFINGPRALEGIQDIFLVVVRPASMSDFCVNGLLETAHLDVGATFVNDSDQQVVEFTLDADPPNLDKCDENGTTSKTMKWEAPQGWEIDVDATRTEEPNIVVNTGYKTGTAKVATVRKDSIELYGEATWHTYCTGTWPFRTVHPDSGHLKFNVTVHLKPKKTSIREHLRSMFLNARNLCCCPPSVPGPGGGGNPCDPHRWISYEVDLQKKIGAWPVVTGKADEAALLDSAELSAILRKELIESIDNPLRPPNPCESQYAQSDAFFARTADLYENHNLTDKVSLTVEQTPALAPTDRDKIVQNLGTDVSVGTLLRTSKIDLAAILDKSTAEAAAVKEQLLLSLMPQTQKPETTPLRNVIGVRFGSTYPDPTNPRVLFDVETPAQVQTATYEDRPNLIDITFNGRPDNGTVNASNVFVTKNGSAVSTTIQVLTATSIRIVINDALTQGDIYQLTVTSAVKFGGRSLDGDPFAFPSGDGVEGGNFVLNFRTSKQKPLVVAPDTLLKVSAVRVSSTVPSPTTPRLLAEVANPADAIMVYATDTPNVIEIAFTAVPDAGTITTSSVQVLLNGAVVNTTLTTPSPDVAKLVINDPIVAGNLYTIVVKGSSNPPVLLNGRRLDGEPTQFPSGNNVEGADFVMVMKTLTPPVSISAPPAPAALVKVAGARIISPTRTLVEVINPSTVQYVKESDLADTVELDLNVEPDAGTVTGSTFKLMKDNALLAGTVTSVTPTVIRIKTSAPFTAGDYKAVLVGTGSPAVTLGSVALDGEPTQFPSGNGTAGADFTMQFTVTPSPAAPPDPTTLKVKGILIKDNVNPAEPNLLVEMTHPSEIPQVKVSDKASRIDVPFSSEVSAVSVTSSSFIVTGPSGPVAGTVTMLDLNTASFQASADFVAGLYTIVLHGTTSPKIVSPAARSLDGEPTQLPSGNGVDGGDFVCQFRVLP